MIATQIRMLLDAARADALRVAEYKSAAELAEQLRFYSDVVHWRTLERRARASMKSNFAAAADLEAQVVQ